MIVAGPCAFESREQIVKCMGFLKSIGVDAFRASLWKPRTFCDWDGIGEHGIGVLLEEASNYRMTPATEVMTGNQARVLVDCIKALGYKGDIIVWIGARNQNHVEQKEIALALMEISESVFLMIKNPMWPDELHWMGICIHVLSVGFPKEKMLLCHRGFFPWNVCNERNFRNLPNFKMAMRVKEKMSLPMLLDPSHIGGSVDNVFRAMHMASEFDFDGYLIEVCENPVNAATDNLQQLSFEDMSKLIKIHENIL